MAGKLPIMSRVPPLATKTGGAEAPLKDPGNLNVPAATTVPPEALLPFERVSVPEPVFVTDPVPTIAAEKVVVVL